MPPYPKLKMSFWEREGFPRLSWQQSLWLFIQTELSACHSYQSYRARRARERPV